MSQKSVIWLFVAAVVVLPISAFKVTEWFSDRYVSLPVLGPEGHTVNDFRFTNHKGSSFSDADINSRITVANVFFSSCPVICPKMIYQLKRVQAYGGDGIYIASFTVDPQRDSVARLATYAKKFGMGDTWNLVTGNKRELYRFARKSLLVVATDGDGGEDDFIHSDNLVLIDPEKKIRGFYKGTNEESVNQLIHDLDKLRNEFRQQ